MTVRVYTKDAKRKKRRVVIHHPNAVGGREDKIIAGSVKEARDWGRAREAELDAEGPQSDRVAPTFSVFSMSRYKPHAQIHLRRTTWTNRKYDVATLIEHIGDMKLDGITAEVVERYKAARVKRVMPRTVNNELMALKAVLRYARDIGVPAAAPNIKKLPTRRGMHSEAWTSEEFAELCAACERKVPRLLPLIVFLVNTGCRKEEALALRWEHVDLERGYVRIWPYDDEAGDFDTKSGKGRLVPINATLRPWLERKRGSATWVFPAPRSTRAGKGKTPKPRRYAQFPKREWRTVVTEAGLSGGPHKLRHTFASHFLSTTPDLYLLAKIMGHSYSAITEKYGHLLPDHLERARHAVALDPGVGPAKLKARERWQTS